MIAIPFVSGKPGQAPSRNRERCREPPVGIEPTTYALRVLFARAADVQ